MTRPTTLDEIRDLAFIDVWSDSKPNLAGLLGANRASTYVAVKRGDWPVHWAGRRARIKVPALLKLLEDG